MSHVTLPDIAKKADVSATTVSRALDNKPDVSSKTKGIEDAAYKRDYSIVLCNTDEEYEKEEEALQVLVEKRMDGLLTIPVQKEYQDILLIKERRVLRQGHHFIWSQSLGGR